MMQYIFGKNNANKINEQEVTSIMTNEEHRKSILAGKYHDKFVKIDGKWYFEELVGHIDQSSPWSEGWVKQPFVKEEW